MRTLLGTPADISRFKFELERQREGLPPSPFKYSATHHYMAAQFDFIVSPFAEEGYILVLQDGGVVGKIDVGGSQLFLKKWEQEGKTLAALIQRLEQY